MTGHESRINLISSAEGTGLVAQESASLLQILTLSPALTEIVVAEHWIDLIDRLVVFSGSPRLCIVLLVEMLFGFYLSQNGKADKKD